MSLNINELLDKKEILSKEMVQLDSTLIKIKKLYYDTNTCISNMINCNNKINELPINNKIYNNDFNIKSIIDNLESWQNKNDDLINKINKRKEQVDKEIESIDKKLKKVTKGSIDEGDSNE